MITFKSVYTLNREKFDKEVNDYLSKGYELVGQPIVAHSKYSSQIYFYQAVIHKSSLKGDYT